MADTDTDTSTPCVGVPGWGGVRRDGGQNQYCAVFVSRGGWYQVTLSFRLPPPTLSRVVDHKTARTRARAAGG